VNHYQTLEIERQATQQEIKQAYRRLAKCFHPDANNELASDKKIVEINAAYEILGDPQRRCSYDRQLRSGCSEDSYNFYNKRQQRTAQAQDRYNRHRQSAKDEDDRQLKWLKEIYVPINTAIGHILNPLEAEIENLSADPFDDELMSVFQAYLENCRDYFDRAQQIFASQPNPANCAAVAASVYYCLDRVSDGIKELEWFSYNYDDHYLHTGTELFRIARRLRCEARDLVRQIA
jgi:molecular chaperone DnaJ